MPNDIYLDASPIRQHAIDWGGPARARPVLLLHGLASNAKIWDFVAPILAGGLHTVALDQRSHGQTRAPADGDYSFATVCADMLAACGQLGLQRPVIVGHSWGGSVALEFAARHPEAVAGVALVDGGFVGLNKRWTWEETEARLAPPRLAGTPLADFQERAKGFMGDLYSEERFQSVLGNFEVRADGAIAPHLAFESHMKIVRAMWEQDADRLYRQVKCPALFLPCLPLEPMDATTAGFLAAKRESAAHIRLLMPQARIDWLADSIHDVPLQRPELVAEKIGGFAASLS